MAKIKQRVFVLYTLTRHFSSGRSSSDANIKMDIDCITPGIMDDDALEWAESFLREHHFDPKDYKPSDITVRSWIFMVSPEVQTKEEQYLFVYYEGGTCTPVSVKADNEPKAGQLIKNDPAYTDLFAHPDTIWWLLKVIDSSDSDVRQKSS